MRTSAYRFASACEDGLVWKLPRNCSIAPAQLAGVYATFCIISTIISTAFWSQGMTMVAPFAAVELLVLGIAFLMYARFATDLERIQLIDGRLEVEIKEGNRIKTAVFVSQWVRVNRPDAPASLIEVSGQGQTVLLGRFVRPELRDSLAMELASAVRTRLTTHPHI